MTCIETKSKRHLSAKLAAGLAISAFLLLGTFVAPAKAENNNGRGDWRSQTYVPQSYGYGYNQQYYRQPSYGYGQPAVLPPAVLWLWLQPTVLSPAGLWLWPAVLSAADLWL